MEVKYEDINLEIEFPPTTREFTSNNILRCLECNLIPLFEFKYKNGIPYIHYCCDNNHSNELLIKDYLLKNNKHKISKIVCNNCGKSQIEINEEFFICFDDDKYFCNSCSIIHTRKTKHNIINLNKYDGLCKKHLSPYIWFCDDCEYNICTYCHSKHEKCDLTLLSKLIYKNKTINHFKKRIIALEKEINNICQLIEKIISFLNKIKEINQNEINYIKKLMFCYELQQSHKNLNYYFLINIYNWIKSTKLFKIKPIINESSKYLNNLQNYIQYPSNNFYNLVTNIQGHTKSITHLDILKDGRLISSSSNNIINVYEKITFKIDLSIKEHKNEIYYFKQLKNGNIITCSADRTMKIIKLGKNNYEILQILEKNNFDFKKIIEIQDNIISISPMNKMCLWKLNYNDIYEYEYKACFHEKRKNYMCTLTYDNILKINNKEFIVSSSKNEQIKFWNWNSRDYSCIITLKNIEITNTLSSMCLINDDILCIIGNELNGLYLIDIYTYQIIKNVMTDYKTIYSITKCSNGTFICDVTITQKKNLFIKCEYENNKVNIISKISHKKKYLSCIEYNNHSIICGDDNGLIQLWNNK